MNSKTAIYQMQRLMLAVSTVPYEATSAETVRDALKTLLQFGGSNVPAVVTRLLHGACGEGAAKTAWSLLEHGVPITGTSNPVNSSFAAYCVAYGTVNILRAVVKAGVPAVVPAELRPADESEWLDLLCTIHSEREHPAFEGFDATTGLVGVAAANADDFTEHCLEALELAWEVNPQHSGFDDLTEEASEGGAFVRSFLMRKGIEMAAPPATAVTPESSRARPKRSV